MSGALSPTPPRLSTFLAAVGTLLDAHPGEAERLEGGAVLLAGLVGADDWLPDAYAAPDPERYRQYLLHRDPDGRFSLVSFVWGPGQGTPIHDHTVWGLVGVLRGRERSQRFTADGVAPAVALNGPASLGPGEVEAVSPSVGDVHQVRNADAGVSISIHLYGADIGSVRRWTYPAEGGRRPFVSGYANDAATPPFLIASAGELA